MTQQSRLGLVREVEACWTRAEAARRFRVLQAEWAYRRRYASNEERLAVLPVFLREYNHARPHGGVGGAVPASRL